MKSKWTWVLVALGFLSRPAFAVPAYPTEFLWGAAFSAHQAEGVAGGGEAGDWWEFEHSRISGRSPIVNGDIADLATDFWNRYSEDIAIARSLGLNTLRTSIAWEKVEPHPDGFNREAIARYRQIFQRMRELGIKPMIALHHFTHPRWFHERGGWLDSKGPQYFLRYAEYVVRHLGDLCDLWITFNEPMVLISMGYLKGEIPPRLSSLDAAYEASFQIARAHRMVAAMIHRVQGLSPGARGPDGRLRGVGLANSFHLYDPVNPRNPKDVQAADVVADLNNWAFLRGVLGSSMRFEIPAEVPGSKNFYRAFPLDDFVGGADAGPVLDWMGVNYYSRYLIQYDPQGGVRANWITPVGPRGDNGWVIDPTGLERVLRQTAARFPMPLVVTENGLSDSQDSRRPQFIQEHLVSLDRASDLDLRGYYHWSLTDNFEWLSGFSQKFGLVEIRYDQRLRRVPRPSARAYQQEIEKRRRRSRREVVPFSDPFQDGYVLTLWQEGLTEVQIREILARMSRAGTRHVALPVFGCQSSLQSSDVGSCEVMSYPNGLRIARLAIAEGFAVSFLPIVTTPRWEWRGFFEPRDVEAWFRSYTAWIKKLAEDAKGLGMQELVVASEFTRLNRFELQWKNVLAEVRQVFHGPLIITVNWGDLDHSFWEDADAIGVSAYYPLSTAENPAQAELDSAWLRRKAEFLELSRRWNRPFHITEVGYSSSAGTARTPWTFAPTDRSDLALQARCFESFKQAWASERTLVRANIWSVTEGGAANYPVNFEVLGKPAEAVLKEFFRLRLGLN